ELQSPKKVKKVAVSRSFELFLENSRMPHRFFLVPYDAAPYPIPLILRSGILGRQRDSNYVVNHRSISTRHANITVQKRQVFVQDLESRNGTFINGERLKVGEVRLGDEIGFGKLIFRLMPSERATEEVETDNLGRKTRSSADRLSQAVWRLSLAQCRVF